MTRRGKSISVSERTKRRLAMRRGPEGMSEHQVIITLLDRIEAIERIVGIGLDIQACGTPVSRNGETKADSSHTNGP